MRLYYPRNAAARQEGVKRTLAQPRPDKTGAKEGFRVELINCALDAQETQAARGFRVGPSCCGARRRGDERNDLSPAPLALGAPLH